MRAVTIKAAKAHLNELIEAAQAGEQIVLMRGSEHVAAIVPITEQDLDLHRGISDEQAARLWRQLAAAAASGGTSSFDSAEKAVAHLRRPGLKPRSRPAPRRR